MNCINFISGGRVGDFIHCMNVVKNICDKENSKANIYITDNGIYMGDSWAFGVDRAHKDLIDTISSQSFVNKFEVLPKGFNEAHVNLNNWRHFINGNSWSVYLSRCYHFEIPKSYKWINIDKEDNDTKDKVVIHRSVHRKNKLFDWNKIINSINEEIVFLTCSYLEWKDFHVKNDKIKLKIVNTIDEMAIAINSCKYFIGNQSSPFAIASALDKNRLVELYSIDSYSYVGEEKYSENISWYLNDKNKYFNEKSIIKL